MTAVVWLGVVTSGWTRCPTPRSRGAEVVDVDAEDPVEVAEELTSGVGVDRVVEADRVDAQRPETGPAAEQAEQQAGSFAQERDQVAPEQADHRRCIPRLLDLVPTGAVDPTTVVTQVEELPVLEACATFGQRASGWTKVLLDPASR